jgi:hypothetical protein
VKLTAGIPTVFGNPGFGRRSVTAVLALAFLALGVTAAPASADPTTVSVDSVGDISYTSAQVKGTIHATAGVVYWRFDYSSDGSEWIEGSSEAAGGPTAGGPISVAGEENIEAQLNGLKGGTKYFVRAVAFNADTEELVFSPEPNPEFETAEVSPPSASIEPVTAVTDTTAHFSGHVDPEPPVGEPAAFDVNWEFKCTPECPGLAGGTVRATEGEQEVKADATGLEPNTAYEVELVATNAGGSVAKAGPESFKTTAVGPVAETVPAFALGNGTEALLGAKINPKNSATTYWFEYGLGPAGTSTYEHSFPATEDASAGSGGQLEFQTQQIEGLSPGTQYHFRVVAKNASGEIEGEDLGFETASALPFPENCPNAKLRAETNSAQLPACRAYEMASDPNKNGGDASAATASSPDGNRVGYVSPAAFADAPASNNVSNYLAERTASGWETRSMTPPLAIENYALAGINTLADFNEYLTKAVSITRTGALETGDHNMSQNIFLTSDDGSTQWTTAPTLSNGVVADKLYGGRSADASHIVFESSQVFTSEADGLSGEVWEWVDGSMRLVSILPLADGSDGPPVSGKAVIGSGIFLGETLGSGFVGTLSEPTAVSTDGRRIFFGDSGYGLFVRENGERSENVALSQRSGSVGESAGTTVTFRGANSDGSHVYFDTTSQMTDDAPPGGGLYVYDLENKILKFVAAAARVASIDGNRTYFTTSEELVPDQGVPGANNLYLEEGEDITFIATLGADALAGGGKAGSTPQATPDGLFFSFESAQRLTAFDNSGHSEVYLYDAANGSLSCASCGPDGDLPAGDASLSAEGELSPNFKTHGISEDGSHVFFQTTDALVPEDVNGRKDVYEYRDGNVALISSGTSNYPSAFWTASSDGADVFFSTRDALVGQDVDGGATDIYDARVNGGFPTPVPPNPCEGDKCGNQAASPPTFVGPATTSSNGRGNTSGRKHKPCRRKTKKQRAKCKHKTHTNKGSKSGRGK